MDETDGLEWTETARWIKFEEDVEEGSGRWGRPHVSALTFHSLVELQQGIDKGGGGAGVGGAHSVNWYFFSCNLKLLLHSYIIYIYIYI